MDIYERDYLLSRILSGVYIFPDYDDYEIRDCSAETKNRANHIFMKALTQGRKNKLLTKPESENLALDSGFFSLDDITLAKKIDKEIEEFQVQMYNNRFDSQKVNSFQVLINRGRKKQQEINDKRLHFQSYTDEGFANQNKLYFLVHNCVYYKDKLYEFDSQLNFDICLKHYIESFISSEKIREIARTVPWVNKWSGIKTNGVVFSSGNNLTQSQELLLMWTSFYDSVQEAYEKPEPFVIQNDDMLDGWLVLQRDKAGEKNKQEFVSKNKKIQEAKEVYLVANNPHDIERINEMNSPESRMIKKRRSSLLQKKGTVKHTEMPDIADEFRKEVNNKILELARKQNGTK